MRPSADVPLPGSEELPGADEVKPLEQEPPPERTDSWHELFTPTDRALWYERPTSQLLPGLVSMLYPIFVVLMPYLFRYVMLALEPSTTKSRVNLRLHWADSTPLPPGRPVAPQPLPAQPLPLPAQPQPHHMLPPGRPAAPQPWPAQPQPQQQPPLQQRRHLSAADGSPRAPPPRAVMATAARPAAPGEGGGDAPTPAPTQLSAPRFATPTNGASGSQLVGGAAPLAVEALRQPRAAATPGSGGGSAAAAAISAVATPASAPAAAVLQRWLALAAKQLGPAAGLMLPPAWLRLLGAAAPSSGDDVTKSYSAGTYEGLVRAKNEVDANSNLIRFEGPQLFGKLGALLINVVLFFWSWLKLLLLYMVEPLIHVMSHAVKLTEPLTKLKVFDKWTAETATVLDEFQLLLKSSGANIGAFLMASELAKAFLVPVLVGFWPAVSMGQMTLAALDSAINR